MTTLILVIAIIAMGAYFATMLPHRYQSGVNRPPFRYRIYESDPHYLPNYPFYPTNYPTWVGQNQGGQPQWGSQYPIGHQGQPGWPQPPLSPPENYYGRHQYEFPPPQQGNFFMLILFVLVIMLASIQLKDQRDAHKVPQNSGIPNNSLIDSRK